MGWFTVSTIVGFKKKGSDQLFPGIEENLYLVEASDIKEAMAMAADRGKFYACANDDMTINGEPAFACFVGVRNATEILNFEDPISGPPRSGTEIGYNLYSLNDPGEVNKILNGEDVKLTLHGL